MPTIVVLGVCGSLRRASCNGGLLRAAAAHAATLGAPAKVEFRMASIASLPLYSGDLDGADAPAAVAAWREAVGSADAVFIASPEHNFSMSAALKNALDWASTKPANLWAGKAAAVVGAGGGSGTARAQLALRQSAVFLDLSFVNAPELNVKRFEEQCFDELTGELTSDKVRDKVAHMVERLVGLALALRAGGSQK